MISIYRKHYRFHQKILELAEFSKIAGYKINIQKFVVFLYTNELAEGKVKKIIPFTFSSKRIKYLGINLTKGIKDLCSENCKTLKRTQINEKIHHAHVLEGLIWFLKNFYCYSITVVCIFSPSLHPTPAKPTSLLHLHRPPWFCPCVLYD